MKWKDFFYYQERDKRGILLLFILIGVLLLVHLLWQKNEPSPSQVQESDSLKMAFESFQKTIVEDERMQRNQAFEKRRQEYYSKYRQNYYTNRNNTNNKNFSETRPIYAKQEKLAPGQTISLNQADTTEWKKIPGIGSGYAKRIVKYRDLLGGFSSVEQLREVYGMTDELFTQISPYIKGDLHFHKLMINTLTIDDLRKHPYLNYRQARVIVDLRQRRGKLSSIKTLQMLDEFSEEDIRKIAPYLSFE